MFQSLRQQTKSLGTYILVGLLIVIFAVFFGGPMGECGDSALRYRIAKVGKTTLYNDDLSIVYGRSFGGHSQTNDEDFLRQQADTLRHLIVLHLLADRAKTLDLRVSDTELKEYLVDPLRNREYGYYNQEGEFSGVLYKNYVQYGLSTSPKKYEEFKKEELLAAKYLDLLVMQGVAPKSEVEAQSRLQKTKVDLEFALFDPEAVGSGLQLTDDEISAFLKNEADAVKKAYDDQIDTYTTPEEILVRRIFINRPATTEGDDAVDAAKSKWENVRARILDKKEDFAAVAKDASEDFAKDKGGLMDWSQIDNIDQDIANALKEASKGEIKEVVTDGSYMLVQLEDRKEKKVTPLKEVEQELAKTLLQKQLSNKKTTALVDEFKTELPNHKTLQEALDALKKKETDAWKAAQEGKRYRKGEEPTQPASKWEAISIDTTGDFTQTGKDLSSMFGGQFANLGISSPWDDVPKVGKSGDLVLKAFSLTSEAPFIQDPMTIEDKTYFFRLAKRTDPTEEELNDDSIRSQITTAAISPLLLPIQGEFLLFAPLASYGPLIDKMYFEAIKNKKVTFYGGKQWDAAPYVLREPVAPIDVTAPPEPPAEEVK